MQEVWKDIENFKGYYQVSNLGRVKSLDREITTDGAIPSYIRKGILLKPISNKEGYLSVSLTKEHKQKGSRIHRLVAQAFIPNLENCLEINHKDFNKQNNQVSNLEWCSRLHNAQHFANSEYAEQHNKKLRHENNPRAILTWEDVNLIRKLRKEYKFKVKRLMWLFNMSKSQINRIIYNHQWVKPEIKEAI